MAAKSMVSNDDPLDGVNSTPAGQFSRRWWWASLGFLHVILVFVGATQIAVSYSGPLPSVFSFYGALSGADAGFNYFAPEIVSELRTRFFVQKPGQPWTETKWNETAAREAQLRIFNVFSLITQVMEDKNTRQLVSASLAGKILGQHEEASQARIVIESVALPSMEDYRNGKRAKWFPFYQATYRRGNAE